jgi:hypothetical protein
MGSGKRDAATPCLGPFSLSPVGVGRARAARRGWVTAITPALDGGPSTRSPSPSSCAAATSSPGRCAFQGMRVLDVAALHRARRARPRWGRLRQPGAPLRHITGGFEPAACGSGGGCTWCGRGWAMPQAHQARRGSATGEASHHRDRGFADGGRSGGSSSIGLDGSYQNAERQAASASTSPVSPSPQQAVAVLPAAVLCECLPALAVYCYSLRRRGNS